jgi:hypothetical protein
MSKWVLELEEPQLKHLKRTKNMHMFQNNTKLSPLKTKIMVLQNVGISNQWTFLPSLLQWHKIREKLLLVSNIILLVKIIPKYRQSNSTSLANTKQIKKNINSINLKCLLLQRLLQTSKISYK